MQSRGGVIGYHSLMLRYLKGEQHQDEEIQFLPPEGFDISNPSELTVRKQIIDGIAHLEEMAEIYPLGGAAERLRLFDKETLTPLPAARLLFCGKTLLEGLIADLRAREYLYEKIYKKKVVTPIAIMTSQEKDNHHHIQAIFEENEWFGRPKESIRFFCQPSVPTMNKEGKWFCQGNKELLVRPGGHGVIWKLAKEAGIFEWFFAQKRKKALVRQINNPIAGVDHGILAFTGIGCHLDKTFGFASCPRFVKASEGMNVLIEKKKGGHYSYTLTNIEYCDFKKFGIPDEPEHNGSLYSKFPSNTNILFVDLKKVLSSLDSCPIPGMLVNLKKSLYRDALNQLREEDVVRLESTMQNIADQLGEEFSAPISSDQKKALSTYLTYNARHKTISTAKKEFVLGASLLETPEGCFIDLLRNGHELLTTHCQMLLPSFSDPGAALSFIFTYSPLLGPQYSLIGQKIRGGKIEKGGELQLEIAELDCENLRLQGSLLIAAGNIEGKCTLKNVSVRNLGIDEEAPNVFWKNEIYRKESCVIKIQGNGEFYAEDIEIIGNHHFEVANGTRLTLKQEKGKLIALSEPLAAPTWQWNYILTEDYTIRLEKESLT